MTLLLVVGGAFAVVLLVLALAYLGRIRRPVWVVVSALLMGAGGWGYAQLDHRVPARWLVPACVAGAIVVALKERPRRRVDRPTDAYFARIAAMRGWTYLPGLEAFRDTPFLERGIRADVGPAFAIPLLGRDAILYEHIRCVEVDTALLPRLEPYVVLRLPLTIPGLPRVSLRPADELETDIGMRPFELESVELTERYRLTVDAIADERVLRRLFTPAFIDAILRYPSRRHYLGDSYELRHGTLVLAGAGTLRHGDVAFIERTLVDVEPILRRFLASEAATVDSGALASRPIGHA